jgi:hypothetical protein
MRKVEFTGWIIFNEDECNHGTDMVSQIEHELFNLDGAVEWEFKELNNEKIE